MGPLRGRWRAGESLTLKNLIKSLRPTGFLLKIGVSHNVTVSFVNPLQLMRVYPEHREKNKKRNGKTVELREMM